MTAPRIVRNLEPADLAAPAPQTRLQRISERHHGLARALAAGMGPGEAAAVMRYTRERVTSLQQDPAFRELVEFYRSKVDDAFDAVHEHLAGMTMEALQELRQRLESEPEQFSNKELRELLTAGLDRTGYGTRAQVDVAVTHDLGERLEAARRRAHAERLAAAKQVGEAPSPDAVIEGTLADDA